ncbi:23S rRNA (adenine(1618)-N(6))-methyltransferase RlmF [uncultured Psychroserpens sp.]|uniref:23S rRNA (adenine(1618)-N(6))-methyltransferase RlmF n=1 Tax=uncultured Psychroserpens sp. TaxID=255436 RepID=UPI00261EA430|nr:23S rRNA (adenine(1618)-N(6))-methyltransferase RlmF [uncultured Psychroserpens sp.]
MHKHNKHAEGYDFEVLAISSPGLVPFIYESNYGRFTIDFANPKAVKALNTALLKLYYGVDFWEFPDAHLCPPIPGRVEYIHLLNDLLASSGLTKDITILDIGTGATCIYPLLGHAEYGWRFIASEIDKQAYKTAKRIIDKNKLNSVIELRFQNNTQSIVEGVINASEQITASMCNPPFYKSEAEAIEHTERKLKGLGKSSDTFIRNFSGTANELWYPGGEKAFLHNYLYQSSLLKTNCIWYTTLVSKKEHVTSMKASLKKLGATTIKVLELSLGHKISRVVAWSFFTDKAIQNLKNKK